jgi:hypothetical protein
LIFEDLRRLEEQPNSELLYWGAQWVLTNSRKPYSRGPYSRPQKAGHEFHYGSLYGLSTKLLNELTNTSYSYPSEHIAGPEDRSVGEWISNLSPETANKVRSINNEGRFIDGPFSNFEHTEWQRDADFWATSAKNLEKPACGTRGDPRKDTLVVHQLKSKEDFQQIVEWWITGVRIEDDDS